MSEIWKKVKLKNFSHYRVSNLGRIFNTRTKYVTRGFIYCTTVSRGPLLGIKLYNKNIESKLIPVHKLVFSHFKSSQLKNYCVWHNDLNGFNNKEVNLSDASRGEILRRSHREINRKRGVYHFNYLGQPKYRATLKINDKVVTLGYTKEKDDAEALYEFGYSMIFGQLPYVIVKGVKPYEEVVNG